MAARLALVSRCQASTYLRLMQLPARHVPSLAQKQQPLSGNAGRDLIIPKYFRPLVCRGIASAVAAFDAAPASDPEEESGKVFVGNLPWSATVQELGDFFYDSCGPVTDVYIPVDRASGRPKGIGFIEFETRESAAEAVQSLNGVDFDGRELVVEWASHKKSRPPRRDSYAEPGEGPDGATPPSNRVFVASLSYDTTWQSLKHFFKQAGRVTYASVSERPDGSSKGCGIVQFETVGEAQAAIEMLNGAELDNWNIVVREDRQTGGRGRRQPRKGSASWDRMQERDGQASGDRDDFY